MGDILEKLLLAALGFLLGTGTTLIVDVVRARRRRSAIVSLIRSEVRAFADACRSAQRYQSWTASNVRRLAELIRDRYSTDPERWNAPRSIAAQAGVAEFYLECASILDLMSLHEERERQGAHRDALPVGPGTYEGIIERSEKLLTLLGTRVERSAPTSSRSPNHQKEHQGRN